MRILLPLFSLVLSSVVSAQNWALINPAYRYNYSDDGTDTISNQILTMNVDSSGSPVMIFTLNTVSLYCESCDDSCKIQDDIPQFLGKNITLNENEWTFNDIENILINISNNLFEYWIFNEQESITAWVYQESIMSIHGNIDSVKSIETSNHDTIIISKNHGIIRWSLLNEPSYTLVGIQTLNLGTLVPALRDFYRYQPADIIEMRSGYSSNLSSQETISRLEINDRSEEDHRIILSGDLYSRHMINGAIVGFSTNTNYSWVIDSLELSPIESWPGQRIFYPNIDLSNTGFPPSIIAKHWKDSLGFYHIDGLHILNSNIIDTYYMYPSNCSYLFSFYFNYYFMDSQLGRWIIARNEIVRTQSFQITGAIINGDTIGTITEEAISTTSLPSITNQLTMYDANISSLLSTFDRYEDMAYFDLFDISGKLVFKNRNKEQAKISINNLCSGIYVLIAMNKYTHKLMIMK